ncbi:MAG: beta-lactamase domain-containing protein [Candidatus Magnetoglobus multicellularis str. Araruama]|uniref:Beta-lactamase domain-containing protein n=1 Tax=Candidatus Magnetoglobus multicellularis str. Araruama TaxID=890399 RepID=A0A1V1PH86_9BACT|nr:MAG: beta-lactamase domain-containing protein [Candidatus Magnetoglobus multicellularis str. Araruama]
MKLNELKIFNLTENSNMYTSNVYFVLGTWNAIDDMNTLVDVGRDPQVIDAILQTHTGLGKPKVNQVILTHTHYDHASMLPQIKQRFRPSVYAYSRFLDGVDYHLTDQENLRLGDQVCEVIYSPGHSHDSICVYCETDGILFCGDTPVVIYTQDGSYEKGFIHALNVISKKDVQIIYPGHGKPINKNCNELIQQTLRNVRKSK